MWKKIIILSICIFLIGAVVFVNKKTQKETIPNTASRPSSISLVFIADNADQLIEKSDLIIYGTLGDIYKRYHYGEVDFTEYNVEINSIYKGSYDGKTIRVLMTGTPERAINALPDDDIAQYNTLLHLKKGTKLLLFLGVGPGFTDDKININPVGLYQGVYVVKDDGKLETSLTDAVKEEHYDKAVKDILENYNTLEKIKNKIKEKEKGEI